MPKIETWLVGVGNEWDRLGSRGCKKDCSI